MTLKEFRQIEKWYENLKRKRLKGRVNLAPEAARYINEPSEVIQSYIESGKDIWFPVDEGSKIVGEYFTLCNTWHPKRCWIHYRYVKSVRIYDYNN